MSNVPKGADLIGRRVLVTGAASGIGAACARAFAGAGAKVVVADLDGKRAEKVASEVGGVAVEVDLSAEDLDATALAGEVDILVNNAGAQYVAAIEDFPPERFHRLLVLMLEAPFRLVRATLPHMYGQRFGRIVNISSVHGLRASPYKSAYVAAKHGLEGLSKVIALEGAAYGVTSNTICPAYVRTPLVEGQITAQARAHDIAPERVLAEVMLAEPAIKRLIEPEEVAALALYLTSPAAAFATGGSYVLDGGWTAR